MRGGGGGRVNVRTLHIFIILNLSESDMFVRGPPGNQIDVLLKIYL